MMAGDLFYPYFRSTVSFAALRRTGRSVSIEPELEAWERLVQAVERHGAVVEANDGEFVVDHDALVAALPDPLYRHSVMQAVSAANGTPASIASRELIRSRVGADKGLAALAEVSKPPSVADVIKSVLGLGADVPAIQENVADIAAGVKVVMRRWWGVELAFTTKAALALSSLLGKNLGGVTTLLTTLAAIPALQVLGFVSGVVAVVLKGFGSWVEAANKSGNGVLLTLYGWVLPFFQAAQEPVTVP